MRAGVAAGAAAAVGIVVAMVVVLHWEGRRLRRRLSVRRTGLLVAGLAVGGWRWVATERELLVPPPPPLPLVLVLVVLMLAMLVLALALLVLVQIRLLLRVWTGGIISGALLANNSVVEMAAGLFDFFLCVKGKGGIREGLGGGGSILVVRFEVIKGEISDPWRNRIV